MAETFLDRLNGRTPAPSKDFFAEWDKKRTQPPTPTRPASAPRAEARVDAYVDAAVARELDRVRNAPAGQRNHELNVAALALGKLVGAGLRDHDATREALGDADTRPGDDGRVAWSTIDSGMRAGMAQPRDVAAELAAAQQVTDDPLGDGHYIGPVELAAPRTAPPSVQTADGGADVSTWAPVDLAPFLDGTRETVQPELMPRTDGVCLLYPGAVHSFHGESESGKSLLLQLLAAQLLNDGEPVLFVDFESDPGSIVDRMRTLGATDDAIRHRFRYVQPETRPDACQSDRAAWTAITANTYRLAIIDGVTDALSVYGYGTKENDDVTAWMRAMPKQIAARTGAAVAIIDHVTKDSEGRGRFAIGGQAKMAGLTGAAYTVTIAEPLGRGMRGVIALRIGKDRPGLIRPHCGPFRKTDRTQEAARIVIDDTGDGPTTLEVQPWRQPGDQPVDRFRPTVLMERVSRFVEDNPEASTRDIRDGVTGNVQAVTEALAVLIDEGYLAARDAPRGAKLHTLTRSYRQATDPRSDTYTAPVRPVDAGAEAA